jgi:peptidoglycan hydrolase-like protein with peptidoglycan-binding domain
MGMSGASVSSLQALLLALGYGVGAIDGQFGPKTKKAVLEFQNASSLAVDGVVGPKTWRILTNI